ncbi:MAG: hypothetical protein M1608_02125 [Candidatus Omnitrophica bacterium]|nr:hypothetical protein [Candidatus Omnitrophota bacterium]
MPTQLVTQPGSYAKWEYNEPVPFPVEPLYDVAAMGRVWYLEATACRRMKAWDRLAESARQVCQVGKADGGYWRDRYHPRSDGTVAPGAVQKYCEYPAILVRVVLINRQVFCA